uniref:Uncharacterized protein n=1 Tax=Amphimedon queenslandica TaxID=400682 RepID=A0A1X7TN44_AMPQE
TGRKNRFSVKTTIIQSMACQFYSFKVFADNIHDVDRSTLPLSQAEFRSSCCSNSESSINTT